VPKGGKVALLFEWNGSDEGWGNGFDRLGQAAGSLPKVAQGGDGNGGDGGRAGVVRRDGNGRSRLRLQLSRKRLPQGRFG